MKLWLYLHFPDLQLNTLYLQAANESNSQALSSKNSHSNTLSSKSVSSKNLSSKKEPYGIVIVEGRRNVIVQLNEQARNEGIAKGMGLATAASLSADLQVHPYDRACEQEKLKEVAHWLYLLTSDICLYEPNGLLLQVSNMLTLYDGLSSYWAAIQQHLSLLEFSYSYATAYSPFAARILARREWNQVTDTASVLTSALQQCSLTETDLSAKQVEKLTRVGVHSVRELLALPLSDLAKRFDTELVNYVGRLSGQFHHSVHFYHPPEQFDRSLDLLFEVENTQFLEKPLLKLLQPMERFLRIRDQFACEVELALFLRDETTIALQVGSAAGEYQAEKWLALFRLRFESVALNSPVIRIALQVARVQARSGEMADLFDGRRGNTSALELVSSLQAKLGEEAVQGVALSDDPRPHLSSHYCQPFAVRETDLPERDPALLRPGILLPEPQPLRQQIAIIRGPERLATGWWDAQPMIRDYFIARAANGSWLWVFRTPEQHWFLHGVFS